MDAIILAGGRGTRLESVVRDVPKVLAPVGERPFLDLLLGGLDRMSGIRKVVLALGHRAELVVSQCRLSRPYAFALEWVIESRPLGTGGAARLALARTTSDPILVMNGDTFVDIPLVPMLDAHLQRAAQCTLLLTHVSDVGRFGRVIVDETTMEVNSFEEKATAGGAAGCINAGVYLFSRGCLSTFQEGCATSLEHDVLPSLIGHGLFGWKGVGQFFDIGTQESYEAVQHGLV